MASHPPTRNPGDLENLRIKSDDRQQTAAKPHESPTIVNKPPRGRMKVLILGGTKFLGRHLVDEAAKAGHEVTVFHRGLGGCTLFPEITHIHGDRDGDLDLLSDQTWDAVVDTSGIIPRLVGTAAHKLAGAVSHYIFVSSISVYSSFTRGMDESASVLTLEDPRIEEVSSETYGGLKVLCESAAEAAMPGRVLHVRSGLIVGPHDPTDRFTYWVRRVSAGGPVAVPMPPDRPMQIIHAADLAAWILRMAEEGMTGIYNATGPDAPFTMETFLETCREVTGGKATWVWIPEETLAQKKVAYWREIPLCIEEKDRGVMAVRVKKAIEDGLKLRPLTQSIRETLAWDAVRPEGTLLSAGLTPEREAELLRSVSGGG